MDDYQRYIHVSRYARWQEENKRRESWTDSVTRYCDFMQEHLKKSYNFIMPYEELRSAVLDQYAMPSMRAMATAGPALERDNLAAFNCAYLPVDRVNSFDEALYVLMCGTGVGYSVEFRYTQQLPFIPRTLFPSIEVIRVRDSKRGWAEGMNKLVKCLFSGYIPKWDLSDVRPAGAPLKTFGGRASGPGPLEKLFEKTVEIFSARSGTQLRPIDCHHIMCKVAESVVVGGVRRSALICLSDLSDLNLRYCKTGEDWSEAHPHLGLANISATYNKETDFTKHFDTEWRALQNSGSGERGIFNRMAAIDKIKHHGRREIRKDFGVNPCGEIILRPRGLCNLTEIVVRSGDSISDLKHKARIAAILGTFQATLTNFKYVSEDWKKNAEEERLLGVSLTGIMDHEVLSQPSSRSAMWLRTSRDVVIDTNRMIAKSLGITPSVACTTVKPSGTVSQLVNSSSGIHPRFSEFYVRRVRNDKKDPLAKFMRTSGIPVEDCVRSPHTTDIFSFPVKAPSNSVLRDHVSAIEQLEHYKLIRNNWCEHNASITVYIRDDEWQTVGTWVKENFNHIGGIAFLPYDGGTYEQPPYTEISASEYEELSDRFPAIDWEDLKRFEHEDNTKVAQELACSAGVCELL